MRLMYDISYSEKLFTYIKMKNSHEILSLAEALSDEISSEFGSKESFCDYLTDTVAERAKEIIEMNRHGEKPVSLQKDGEGRETKKQHTDLLAGGDISRFDKAKKKKKKKNNANKQHPEGAAPQQKPPRPKKQRKPQQDAKE